MVHQMTHIESPVGGASLALRRVLVIYNPAAGRNRQRRLSAVLDLLEEQVCSVTLRETRRRGDAEVGRLVAAIQQTPAWKGKGNVAILIGFDEGSGRTREGCCGVTPGAISNFGGGHIPMVVITNHGPRGVADATPYSHYSLLRTLEDAFRLPDYLGHAADTGAGVVPMVRLFAVVR